MLLLVYFSCRNLLMACTNSVSRWTRKRRTDTELSRVLNEISGPDNTVDERFESDIETSDQDTETTSQLADYDDCSATVNLSTHDIQDELSSQSLDHSDSESCSAHTDVESLEAELSSWAKHNFVSHTAVTALLHILHKIFPSLPKDSRTLFGYTASTNSAVAIKNVAGGKYYHFGIANGLASVISASTLNVTEPIKLVINIDGLPLYRSTAAQFWPILGKVANCEYSDPFVIGIYYGNSKPVDVSAYLRDFVEEFTVLQSSGVVCESNRYSILLTAVVCDTPARSFIKNVKGHTGYFGCDKCTQEGDYVNGRMTFPEIDAHLRTDESFRTLCNEEHHLGTTPFTDLPINMISGFPLDYMHAVCLGVVRKILYLLLKGPLEIRLGRQTINRMSQRLIAFSHQVPLEFGRKPRSLDYLERWKATELRQFLLYTGMFCLRGLVDESVYSNFMLLSVSMSVLLSPRLCHTYCDYAGELLKIFVKNFGNIYGKQNLTYNVHAIVHLAGEVKVHGPLDNVAGFEFENCLGKLKKLIRKPHAPLQQVVRRLSERSMMMGVVHSAVNELRKEHTEGPVPSNFGSCIQYKEYRCRDYRITRSQKDSCVLIGRSVGIVRNLLAVDRDKFVVYQKFSRLEPCYDYPVDSTQFEVYRVDRLYKDLLYLPLHDIRAKCVMVSVGSNVFVVPFAHCG